MATRTVERSFLQRIIRLAYEWREDEEARLARSIYDQRAAAWVGAIREEVQALGVTRSIPFPRGEFADMLRRESITDAHSIRETYNKDLEREIARLYAENPRGNRYYYIKNLEAWHEKRAAWKNRQIALMNNKTARHWAKQAFKEHNGADKATYRFTGPAPVCDDCAAMFAAGQVAQDFVDSHPAPRHPNCPHEWAITSMRLAVPLTELWVG